MIIIITSIIIKFGVFSIFLKKNNLPEHSHISPIEEEFLNSLETQ